MFMNLSTSNWYVVTGRSDLDLQVSIWTFLRVAEVMPSPSRVHVGRRQHTMECDFLEIWDLVQNLFQNRERSSFAFLVFVTPRSP